MMFIRNPYIFAILYYVRFKMPVSVFKGLSALMPANKTLKQNAMLLEKLETRHSRITDTFTVLTSKRSKKEEASRSKRKKEEEGSKKEARERRRKKEERKKEQAEARERSKNQEQKKKLIN